MKSGVLKLNQIILKLLNLANVATIYYLFATQQTYYNQIKIYNCKLLRYVQASQSNLFTLKT